MVRFDLRTFCGGHGLARSAAFAGRLSSVLAAAAALSACTIVKLRDGAGVRTSYYPGVAVIRITPRDSVQLVEVESAGAAMVANQLNLGWSHSRTALVPPGRCQFIVWEATSERLAELKRLFGGRTEMCTQEGEGQ